MLSVRFGRDVYAAGGLLTALFSTPDTAQESGCPKMTVQAVGTVVVDQRWLMREQLHMKDKIFVQKLLNGEDIYDDMVTNSGNEYVIFMTQKEEINCAVDAGIYVQCDLPFDLLPTYKGLCCNVQYNFIVTIVDANGVERVVKFPFNIIGKGSSLIPYYVRQSTLALISGDTLPENTFFVPLADNTSLYSEYADANMSSLTISADDLEHYIIQTPVTYSIHSDTASQQDYICAISLLLSRNPSGEESRLRLHPGDHFIVNVDFNKNNIVCNAVRSKVLECERRNDQSRIQDKIVSIATKTTKCALNVNLIMQIPVGTVCCHTHPVGSVAHKLEIEFFLEGREPYIWSLPVSILPTIKAINTHSEINACLETKVMYNE
jgi:hypothetical protein